MSSSKTTSKQQAFVPTKEFSNEYRSIRREAESKWPAWKVSTYNVNFATSAHAKKVGSK
jgi:hypothetical protein